MFSNRTLAWITVVATLIFAFVALDFFSKADFAGAWLSIAAVALNSISAYGYFRRPTQEV
jgi:hypothetical protein